MGKTRNRETPRLAELGAVTVRGMNLHCPATTFGSLLGAGVMGPHHLHNVSIPEKNLRNAIHKCFSVSGNEGSSPTSNVAGILVRITLSVDII